MKRRRDLRGIDVVSVDPPGCKDIDDALHCIRLENGNIQAGVHIADVTYFVRPDTAIDKEAAHRCTTVYLVNRRTDMLPKLLTENLCSLRSNVDRLAFSVIWEFSPDGQTLLKTDFTKSIICSRQAFTYEQAQNLISSPSDSSNKIQSSLVLLNFMAKILKSKRIAAGALSLASTQLKFTLDTETHNPTDVSIYSLFETNSMVEEFMLLANCSVAEKISSFFPSNSILRHHSPPKPKHIKQLSKLMDQLGYQLDYSTSKTLADSLDRIQRVDSPFFNTLIRVLTTRCMNEAHYFCTADVDYSNFFHYGLAVPLYTHFTSPIRRYADVLVHRYV